MGNIKFVGFTHGFIELEKEYILLPNNAVKITEYADDMNIINLFLAIVPIIVIICILLLKKIKRYNVLDDLKIYVGKCTKSEKHILISELKFIIFSITVSIIFLIVSMIFHEFLHAICEYIFGKSVIVGFNVTSMIGYVKSLSSVYTKFEKISILVLPALVMGVFPILICFLIFKKVKNKLIVSLIILLSCVNISLCCADFIDTYNYIKYVPNGAIIQIYDNDYYYIKNK